MKNKMALKQSNLHAKFLSVILGVSLVAWMEFPSILLGLFLGIVGLYLTGEIYNIIRINKRAKQDETFLEKRTR